MHKILVYAGTEVLDYVKSVKDNISIDYSIPCPITIECKTCSLTKAKQIVSQQPQTEFKVNDIPFDCMSWDLIDMNPVYNGD